MQEIFKGIFEPLTQAIVGLAATTGRYVRKQAIPSSVTRTRGQLPNSQPADSAVNLKMTPVQRLRNQFAVPASDDEAEGYVIVSRKDWEASFPPSDPAVLADKPQKSDTLTLNLMTWTVTSIVEVQTDDVVQIFRLFVKAGS